jgi:hypothetical protein
MRRYRYELTRGDLQAVDDVWATTDSKVEAFRTVPLRPRGKRGDRAAAA